MRSTCFATILGVLLGAPLSAQAQPSNRLPDPSQPDAPVPALAYESVLDAQARPPALPTPDQAWRQANAALTGGAAAGGHAQDTAAPVPGRQEPTPPASHQHRQHGQHGQDAAKTRPAPAHGHHHTTREQP